MADRLVGENWHLDKKVPLALIASLFIQAVTFVWWASAINSQSATHERRIDQAERRLDAQDNSLRLVSEKVIRIDANTENIGAAIIRIERVLGREDRRP